jgi:hypothetical protein
MLPAAAAAAAAGVATTGGGATLARTVSAPLPASSKPRSSSDTRWNGQCFWGGAHVVVEESCASVHTGRGTAGPAVATAEARASAEAGVLALFQGGTAAAEAMLDGYVSRIIQRACVGPACAPSRSLAHTRVGGCALGFLGTEAVHNVPPDSDRLAEAFSDFVVPAQPLAAYGIHRRTRTPRLTDHPALCGGAGRGEYFRRLNEDVVATSTRVASPLMVGHMVSSVSLSLSLSLSLSFSLSLSLSLSLSFSLSLSLSLSLCVCV